MTHSAIAYGKADEPVSDAVYDPVNDAVNHPAHHTHGGIEAIDVMEAKLTGDQLEGYLLGNALKYLMRCNHKGVLALDIKKAEWYVKRLAGRY